MSMGIRRKSSGVGAEPIDFQNFFMEINLLSLCGCGREHTDARIVVVMVKYNRVGEVQR